MANRGPDQDVDSAMPRGEDSRPGRWSPTAGSPKEPDVSTPSAAYRVMAPRWARISTLLAGTEAMRAAGREYLPPHQYETPENYDERLTRATLKNYTLRTLETLVGKAFKDPPRFTDEAQSVLVELAEDIDQEGSDFVVFARSWFRSAMAKAFSFVLVDYSRTQSMDGLPRTLEDDRREGVRPFWRLIEPEDVIFLQVGKVGGKLQFTHVRIREFEQVPNGRWGERLVERIRVLTPGAFELWEKTQHKGKKAKWALVDGGPMDLPSIPLVAFYTSRAGLGEGKPLLEDLAFINIEHWQSTSDQRNILTVARFPMLAVSGAGPVMDGDKPVVIGPKQWLSVADPAGRIYYVEHAGNAIAAGASDLEALEDQMASYGAEFLRRRPGNASATGRALDSAEAMSPLQAMAVDFKDALELAFRYTMEWMGLPVQPKGLIDFEVKPDITVGDGKDLEILDAARVRKDISRMAFLAELVRRDILDPEYDAEDDRALIDDEPPPPGGLTAMSGTTGPVKSALK